MAKGYRFRSGIGSAHPLVLRDNFMPHACFAPHFLWWNDSAQNVCTVHASSLVWFSGVGSEGYLGWNFTGVHWLLAYFRTTFAVGDTTWVYSWISSKKKVNLSIVPSVSNLIFSSPSRHNKNSAEPNGAEWTVNSFCLHRGSKHPGAQC